MIHPHTILFCLIAPIVAIACAGESAQNRDTSSATVAQGTPGPALTADEQAAGWTLLFDGKTTTGWRPADTTGSMAGWQVVDGALTRVASSGDIVTTDLFANFELALEWKVAPNGNSGIFYRVPADTRVVSSGPEMQVLDDAGHPDGKSPLTSAGSMFALYPAPRGIVRPADEWNQVRIVVNGNHVEHWLNGTKIVDAQIGSADWNRPLKISGFAQTPGYGLAAPGRIALQDHGDRVAYRNIRIQALP